MVIRTSLNSFEQLANFPLNSWEKYDLNFSCRSLTHENLEFLTEWMKERHIEVLDLSGTQMDDQGAQIISTAIKTQRSLTNVYLSDNRIGDPGAKALADAFLYSSVSHCTLHRNQIGADGGEMLARALAAAGLVQGIDLSSNRLGDEGAFKVAQALQREKGNIRLLHLADNEISSAGDRALAEHLPQSIEVYYRSEPISAEAYFQRHPYIALGMMICLFPIFALTLICGKTFEEPVYGTLNPRTGPA